MPTFDFRRFRIDVCSDYFIVALGPVGFISLNTHAGYSYPWGTFTAWLDVPGGSLELNMEGPPRDDLSSPLLSFMRHE